MPPFLLGLKALGLKQLPPAAVFGGERTEKFGPGSIPANPAGNRLDRAVIFQLDRENFADPQPGSFAVQAATMGGEVFNLHYDRVTERI